MAIVGPRPESGVRIELERVGEGASLRYDGEAVTPDRRFALGVTLAENGDVRVDLPPEAPAGLSEKVRLLVRTLWRRARDEGTGPPRRFVRWRPDA